MFLSETALKWFKVFPGLSVVFPGAPKLVPGTPRLVTSTTRIVTGAPRLVPGAPRLVNGTLRISAGIPKSVTGTPRFLTSAPRHVTGIPSLVASAPLHSSACLQMFYIIAELSPALPGTSKGHCISLVTSWIWQLCDSGLTTPKHMQWLRVTEIHFANLAYCKLHIEILKKNLHLVRFVETEEAHAKLKTPVERYTLQGTWRVCRVCN